MATFNRFLITLIALMAIGAAVLSYFLFEKRNAFVERSADLAETVQSAAGSLDEESGTRITKDVQFSRRDPQTGDPESGSLSWSAYLEDPAAYNATLDKVEDLAKKISAQRNYLAEELRNIAEDLGFPPGEIDADNLKNADDPEVYRDTVAKVARLADAVRERSDALISTIQTNATELDLDFNSSPLTEREPGTDEDGDPILKSFTFAGPLQDYREEVVAYNTKFSDYRGTLAAAIDKMGAYPDWTVDPADVKTSGGGYSSVLTSIENSFQEINDLLEDRIKVKQELAAKTEELKEVEAEKERLAQERNELQQQLAEKEAELAGIDRGEKTQTQDTTQPEVGSKPTITKDLIGKVLMVNDEWNFVIVDLGAQKVHEKHELLVARDDEYVARIEITGVAKNISVAEIIPETQQAQVRSGDRIVVPADMIKAGKSQ